MAAMITPEGTDFFPYGSISENPERTLDEHTQFAVASISKLFTTLALVELMREGKLRFEDTVDTHLPAGIQLPSKEGKAITLAHRHLRSSRRLQLQRHRLGQVRDRGAGRGSTISIWVWT